MVNSLTFLVQKLSQSALSNLTDYDNSEQSIKFRLRPLTGYGSFGRVGRTLRTYMELLQPICLLSREQIYLLTYA